MQFPREVSAVPTWEAFPVALQVRLVSVLGSMVQGYLLAIVTEVGHDRPCKAASTGDAHGEAAE